MHTIGSPRRRTWANGILSRERSEQTRIRPPSRTLRLQRRGSIIEAPCLLMSFIDCVLSRQLCGALWCVCIYPAALCSSGFTPSVVFFPISHFPPYFSPHHMSFPAGVHQSSVVSRFIVFSMDDKVHTKNIVSEGVSCNPLLSTALCFLRLHTRPFCYPYRNLLYIALSIPFRIKHPGYGGFFILPGQF